MNNPQAYQEKSRLGRLLVSRGYLTEAQLETALQTQRSTQVRLGELLVSSGTISQRDLDRVLRHQSRYRRAAAFIAMVAVPLQPAISLASTTTSPGAESARAGELHHFGSRIQPLSDADLDQVTGQGRDSFLERLTEANLMAGRAADSVGGEDLVAELEPDARAGLALVAHTFVPVLNLLESDLTVTGVHYSADRPRYQILADGGLKLALPERIEEVRMDNIRVSGSQLPAMGNVSLHDIRFDPASSMTIRTR